MSPAQPNASTYRRIGPRAQRLLGSDRLWLAGDHLLAVRNRRFSEEYQRFELRDIQAIVSRNQLRFVMPVYLLPACFVALITAAVGSARASAQVETAGWALLAALVLYWLLASIFFSCGCSLQTAVGAYELPGLYRRPAARRAIEQLTAKIAEVQGTLPEDWDIDDTFELPPARGADEPAAGPESRTPVLAMGFACFAVLFDALMSWLIRFPNPIRLVTILNRSATVLAVLVSIVAIVLSRKEKRFRPLRILFLTAVIAVGVINYGETLLLPLFAAIKQLSTVRASIDNYLYWANQIVEIPVGLFGILLLVLTRRRSSAP